MMRREKKPPRRTTAVRLTDEELDDIHLFARSIKSSSIDVITEAVRLMMSAEYQDVLADHVMSKNI